MAPCHGFPNNSRTQSPLICLAFLICASCTISAFALFQRFDHPTKPDGSLSFLVIGDWGRRGFFNQSHVALQMGKIGEKLDVDFVISTGDNFYDNGLIGPYDPAFEDSFTKVYTAKSLQKQWYSVLGNHDYRGDAEAQLDPHLKKIDNRWFCQRSFILNTEIAEFFFIDTSPLVNSYVEGDGHTYDWKGIEPRNHYIKKLLDDLEKALSQSNAKWKFVVGHHAIRSAGHHGDTHELVQYLLPLLKAYNVDMYMNGHDHCLEHISSLDSPLQYLTSGAGSKAWRGDTKQFNKNGLKFFYDGQGFMSVQLTPTDAQIVFYDVFGEAMHKWNTFKGPQYSAM